VRDATRLHAMRELKKGRQKTQSLNKNINKMPAKLKEHAKLKKTALKLKKNVAK
jgi:hypothetical protein